MAADFERYIELSYLCAIMYAYTLSYNNEGGHHEYP